MRGTAPALGARMRTQSTHLLQLSAAGFVATAIACTFACTATPSDPIVSSVRACTCASTTSRVVLQLPPSEAAELLSVLVSGAACEGPITSCAKLTDAGATELHDLDSGTCDLVTINAQNDGLCHIVASFRTRTAFAADVTFTSDPNAECGLACSRSPTNVDGGLLAVPDEPLLPDSGTPDSGR